MLSEIKKELIRSPDKLVKLLESFGYCHIKLRDTYIQFGRDDNKDSSTKSIVIKLTDNDYLNVKDYPKNIYCNLFSYIIEQRSVEFHDIFNVVKSILNISDYYTYFEPKTIFGGFYDKIKKKNDSILKTYDYSVLNQYNFNGNIRFLEDNISLEAQRYFGIRYDVISQCIVIPIHDQLGQLIGAKARVNFEIEDGEQKYYYLIPCRMSQTLYGYSQNYRYLADGTIFIFEAEKSPMQAFTYGIRNCIALGSSSLSTTQAKMIMELNPKKVIFLHDEGLDFDVIEKNIHTLQLYTKMFDVEIGYWNNQNDKTIPHKASPTDLGKKKFEEIINTQIKYIGGDFD